MHSHIPTSNTIPDNNNTSALAPYLFLFFVILLRFFFNNTNFLSFLFLESLIIAVYHIRWNIWFLVMFGLLKDALEATPLGFNVSLFLIFTLVLNLQHKRLFSSLLLSNCGKLFIGLFVTMTAWLIIANECGASSYSELIYFATKTLILTTSAYPFAYLVFQKRITRKI